MKSRGKGSGRLQRIEAQMQRELAALLQREVKDPRVGPVTITQVALAPDLSHARVFFVPFGATVPAVQDSAPLPAISPLQQGLDAAAGFLRGEVGRRVGLRHAPRLEFVADDSFDRAARLSALIDSAKRSQE